MTPAFFKAYIVQNNLTAFRRPVDYIKLLQCIRKVSALRSVYTVDSSKRTVPKNRLFTMPHAGYAHSGELAAHAALEAIESSPKVLLLWFCHAEGCESTSEHSRTQTLAMLMGVKAEHTQVRDASDFKYPDDDEIVVVSTDFSHLNVPEAPAVSANEVAILDQTTISRYIESSGAKVLGIAKERERESNTIPRWSAPCGRNPLRATIDHLGADMTYTVDAHGTSSTTDFVSYMIVRGFKTVTPQVDWHNTLLSKTMCVHHMEHVRQGSYARRLQFSSMVSVA